MGQKLRKGKEAELTYREGSPESMFTRYMMAWKKRDIKGMLDMCSYTWIEKSPRAKEKLELWFGEVFLKGEDDQNIQARIVSGRTVFTEGFNVPMKVRMRGNPSIHWRAYNHRGHIYLAMVNCCQILKEPHLQTDEEALEVKVEFTGFGDNSKIILLDGESEYRYQSGLLTVTLKPLGVAVFKLSR